MNTSNKIAVVTGAGSGIGRATAIALSNAGYGVVLVGRRAEALQETLDQLGAGKVALAVPTDVSQPESVNALFAQVSKKFGRVDVLFNNAGINATGFSFEDLPYEKWAAVIDINLSGMFLCAQAAFRLMKAQDPRGGRIINNGSISAHSPRPDSAAYTAAKHGVTGLTKCISLDGRKYDIACGQIDIGNAMSEMSSYSARGAKQANGEIAVEPMIDVKLVADAVVHMSNLPLGANVQSMMIMATCMPFIGRG